MKESQHNILEKDIQYDAVFQSKRDFFDRGETLPYKFRMARLKDLEGAVRKWEGRIAEALHADLGKSEGEAYLTEIGVVYEELAKARGDLKSWMKPRKRATPLAIEPSRSAVYPTPKGVALIIAPWNYPFNLLLAPLIGAMAAGNAVVLKPSEDAPATAQLVEEMLKETFDASYIEVVQGLGHEVVPALIEGHEFNHIFFTGSPAVGRKIAIMAATHLTSTTLELGGKSPAIVDETANLKVAARRVTWGKFTNAGQTCVSPDYLLVAEAIKAPLVEEMRKAVKDFYGDDPKSGNQYARMINRKRFDAVVGYLAEARIIFGGDTDAENLYIAPTLVDEVEAGSALMEEEIFGPVLPILTFRTDDDLLRIIRKNRYPLSLYYFGKDKKRRDFIIERVEFGGGCINNTLVHLGNPELPFGGIQQSGSGHYHGRYGFEAFSHLKSVVDSGTWIDPSIKYPPYTKGKMKWIKKLLG